MAFANPGVVDSPEIRRRNEKANTISSKLNSIVAAEVSDKKLPTTSASNFHPLQITHEDVVMGTNSVYGSQFTNGGIIFAITGQNSHSSSPLMSAGKFQQHFLILILIFHAIIHLTKSCATTSSTSIFIA